MNKSFLLGFSLLIGSFLTHTLNATETLFTINNDPVSSQEFSYIYQKNSINGQAEFSRNSLEDYLKLFINYKLKVQQAKDLGLDTVSALNSEYDGYRKQLLETHIQRQIVEPLVKQEYERSKKDIAISHIFVDKKSDNAEKKIQEALKSLKKGDEFAAVAKKYSSDLQSAEHSGRIGYFTAMQIGFPQIENAIYNTPENNYSDIVQTDLGYHILRVDDIRPARGRIKVAIIKLNYTNQNDEMSKARKQIDSIYAQIKSGARFSELAVKYSEDANSSVKGGELDWFGINTYVKEFEDAAFDLTSDGEVSAPFTTGTAWYIIKRLMLTQEQSFEEAEPVMKTKLLRSRMYLDQLAAFNQYLKSIGQFKLYDENVNEFEGKLIPVIDKFPFEYQHEGRLTPLVSITGKDYNQNQIIDLYKNNYTKVTGKLGIERIKSLFDVSVDELLMDVYEKKLVDSLYEYRSLLEEYKNGVLIFELTKDKVWNKATTDTVGLQKFYQQMGDKYKWNTRVEILKIQSKDSLNVKAITKIIKKNKLTDLNTWNKYLSNNPNADITVISETIEKDVTENAPQIVWEKGVYNLDNHQIYQVIKVLPAQRKDLSEVRGFVVAAYQEYLEKEWINDLHKTYSIKVNDQALQKLVR